MPAPMSAAMAMQRIAAKVSLSFSMIVDSRLVYVFGCYTYRLDDSIVVCNDNIVTECKLLGHLGQRWVTVWVMG